MRGKAADPMKKYIGTAMDETKRYKYSRAMDNPNDKKAQKALAYFRAKSFYQAHKDKKKDK